MLFPIWDSITSWLTPTVLFVLLNLMIATIAFTTSLANHQKPNNTQNDPHRQPPPIARSPSVLQRLRSLNFYNSYGSQDFTTHLNPPLDSQTHQPQTLETQPQFVSSQTHQPKTPKTETHQSKTPKTENYEPEPPKTETREAVAPKTETHQRESPKTETQFGPDQIYYEQEDEKQQSMDEIYSQLSNRHHHRTQSETKPASSKVPAKMRKSASVKSVFKHIEEEEIVETRRPATVREGNATVTEVDEVDAKADDFINRFKQQLKLQRLDSILKYKR